MTGSIREVVAVFDDENSLDKAVYVLQTQGFDRSAFSLLASEESVAAKLGHGYRLVKDVEDDPIVPRDTFFSRISRLEADYLPTPIFASVGALAVVGIGSLLTVLVAAGAGAALGVALSRVLHEHFANRIQEQLARGGLLLWVNIRNSNEEDTALSILRAHSAHDVHVHDVSP